jgi:spore coat polysaccharide biosynthesis predicted glycosyltransferase SpsG
MNLVLKLSEYFFQFEREHFNEIQSIRIKNKLGWYHLKIPLFYYIYHATINKESSSESKLGHKTSFVKNLKALKRVGLFSLLFWTNWAKIKRKSKTHKTIIIPLTIDKRLKSGKYKNILFDELILNDVIHDPLILGISKEGDMLEPSLVPEDSYLDHLSHLSTIRTRFYKKKNRYEKELRILHKLILKFLEVNKIDLPIDFDWVLSTYSYHLAEYEIYLWLFKILKPNTLVVTDQSFTGKIHAATDLNIRVIEYQHGLMDEYYPHYTLPAEYKTLKEYLVLENKIVVFGEFFRAQILKHGFWNKEDIIVTGNTQINEVRHFEEQRNNKDILTILFPTQGRYSFNKTVQVLDQLKELNTCKINIIIKPHPLEPEECLDYYRKIAASFPIFRLIEEKVSIFKLILESQIVLGFDSTTLLEAIAMGKPAITIASEEFPYGIHTMLSNHTFEEVIRVIRLEDKKLVNLLLELFADQSLLENWKIKSLEWGNFLYGNNYIESSRGLFSVNVNH